MKTKVLLLLLVLFTINQANVYGQEEGDSYKDKIEMLADWLDSMKIQFADNQQKEILVCQQLADVVSFKADSISNAHNGVIPDFIYTHFLGYLKRWFVSVEEHEDSIFSLHSLKRLDMEKCRSKIEECEKALDSLKTVKSSYDVAMENGDASKALQLEEELNQRLISVEKLFRDTSSLLDVDIYEEGNHFVKCFDRYIISVNDVFEKDNVRTSNLEGIDWTYTINKSEMTCEVGAVNVFTDGEVVFTEIQNAIDRQVSGEVIIPSEIDGYKVVGILSSAFSGCNEMTSLIIPSSVERIRERTFSNCAKLSYVQLPDNLKEVPNNCFYNCSSLTSVKLPSAITVINAGTFSGCTNLTAIDIPVGVKTIDYSAFRDSGLKEIDIPQGVESIGSGAFNGCANLKRVFISKTVKEIGNPYWKSNSTHWYTSFANTPSLSSIVVEDGNPVFDSRNGCNAIIETATNELIQGCKSTVIPGDVEIIGAAAFVGQTEMTTITIPASVKQIDGEAWGNITDAAVRDGAFYKCAGLNTIYSYITSPFEINEAVFGNAYYSSPEEKKYAIYKNATLYVPKGTKELYLATKSWNMFENIVEFEPASITGVEADNKPVSVYDLSGRKINHMQKGINILQDANGVTRKVVVR